MPGFHIYRERDIDGRFWEFPQQQKDYSCGPASVRIAKEYFHNRKIGSDLTRGMVGLEHLGRQNTGMTLLQAANNTNNVWTAEGTLEKYVLPAVRKPPYGIPNACFAKGIQPLRRASRNHPAILGFNWTAGGGHFVVCVGPTRTDADLFVILDPDSGLQYLSADDAVGNALFYNPERKLKGQIDHVGYIIT